MHTRGGCVWTNYIAPVLMKLPGVIGRACCCIALQGCLEIHSVEQSTSPPPKSISHWKLLALHAGCYHFYLLMFKNVFITCFFPLIVLLFYLTENCNAPNHCTHYHSRRFGPARWRQACLFRTFAMYPDCQIQLQGNVYITRDDLAFNRVQSVDPDVWAVATKATISFSN